MHFEIINKYVGLAQQSEQQQKITNISWQLWSKLLQLVRQTDTRQLIINTHLPLLSEMKSDN
jgi:hypothetical protein